MERLRGPFNPSYFGGEHLNERAGEGGGGALGFIQEPFMNPEKMRFVEEGIPFPTSTQNIKGKMSFLEMLRGVESSSSFIYYPNFEFLLRMQQQQQQQMNQKKKKKTELDCGMIKALELESCITNDLSETHSPIKSEEFKDPQPSSCPEMEVVSSSAYNGDANSPEKSKGGNHSSRAKGIINPPESNKAGGQTGSTRERKKRKRTRPSKNKEEVESQRINHIAVERNRRRLMNDHLNALRSLIPTSFIRRGDQASIIGGAIDFVKELEQLLQLLEAQKIRKSGLGDGYHFEESSATVSFNGFLESLPHTTYYSSLSATAQSSAVVGYNVEEGRRGDDDIEEAEGELKAENMSTTADIEVLVTQKRNVNLKILSTRGRQGQLMLLRAIAALEDLRLTILHLNITSSQTSVHYSFNLKMEDECKLGSADEIAAAMHETFSLFNGK